MIKTWYIYYFIIILQGSFQFLKLYGYPDVVSTLCNATVSFTKQKKLYLGPILEKMVDGNLQEKCVTSNFKLDSA